MTPHLFLIAGAPDSGKGELTRAVRRLGVGRFELVRRFTTRPRQTGDGNELCCRDDAGWSLDHCDVRYSRADAEYGIRTADLWQGLGGGRSQVCPVSDANAISRLKEAFGGLAISVYIHHENQAEMARTSTTVSPTAIDAAGPLSSISTYWSAFRMYSEHIVLMDHVLLHAGAAEDLFDQLARLATSYETRTRL